MLKFPPYKHPKIGQHIAIIKRRGEHVKQFLLYDRTKNDIVGQMYCIELNKSQFNNDFIYRVNYLFSYVHNQGIGRILVNLAKKDSLRGQANGQVKLIATDEYDKQNPPYLFYKRMGFKAVDESINSYLDKCLKNKSTTNPNIINGCYEMVYNPPRKITQATKYIKEHFPQLLDYI